MRWPLVVCFTTSICQFHCGTPTTILLEAVGTEQDFESQIVYFRLFAGSERPHAVQTPRTLYTGSRDLSRISPVEDHRNLATDPWRVLIHRGTMQDEHIFAAIVGFNTNDEPIAFAVVDAPLSFTPEKILRWQLDLHPNRGEVIVNDTGCFDFETDNVLINVEHDKDCDENPIDTDCDNLVPYVCDPLLCQDHLDATDHRLIGLGSRDNPYIICTPEQFVAISENTDDWDAHYRLGNNIGLDAYDETSFVPIGDMTTPFSGQFDGDGHTVSNFSYSAPSDDQVGLFGVVQGADSEIRNLHVASVAIVGATDVGGVVGLVQGGRVVNTTVDGTVTGQGRVGGLVGKAEFGVITSSGANVLVQAHFGSFRFGGLVGRIQWSWIINSYATGDIVNAPGGPGASQMGGLVGGASSSQIHDSYSTGSVSGNSVVGGFCGAYNDSVVIGSFAIGDVESNSVGNNTSLFIGTQGGTNQGLNNFFNNAATCATSDSSLCNNTRGNPTGVDLLAQPTYFFGSNEPIASWNLNDSWQLVPGDFPMPAPSFLDRYAWRSCFSHLGDVPFAGGAGTAENPYLICNAAQLQALGADSSHWVHNRHYRLMSNIDMNELSGSQYNIIGLNETTPFSGYFNGNGYRIENFFYDDPSRDNAGIFGFAHDARIERVAVIDADVRADSAVGILVGNQQIRSYIFNTYVKGQVSGRIQVGGLVGRSQFGKTKFSYSQAEVLGDSRVGGMVGNNNEGHIQSSFVVGPVSGLTAEHIGRVAGEFDPTGPPVDVYYDQNSDCDNCTTQIGTPINLEETPERFFDPSAVPLSEWDFRHIWLAHDHNFPTFR